MVARIASAAPTAPVLESRGADAAEGAKRTKTSNQHRPYCGVANLHAAMRLLGRSPAFPDLLRPEYISQRTGSSLSDLERAGAAFGIHTCSIARMTWSMLRQSDCPVLLHVKHAPGDLQYNHWLLYTGISDDKVCFYDGTSPRASYTVDREELAGVWGGTGILVSNRPISLWTIEAVGLSELLLYFGLTLFAAALISALYNRLAARFGTLQKAPLAAALAQALLLIGAALFAASLAPRWLGVPFLSSSGTIVAIQQQHSASFLPRISKAALQRLLSEGAVTIVDARWRRDFETGHIGNAVNLEPNVSDAECLRKLAPNDHRNTIVVYCQTHRCPYSDLVATRLTSCGFTNVHIFKGGWAEWADDEKGK
jgi:rhodanese-related sulfurtransferase